MKPDTKDREETRNVTRRRRHKGSGIKRQPATSQDAGRADTAHREIPPLLKSLMEEVAVRARAELTDNGRITPRAFFLYDEESGSKTVSVALSFRSEQQKDAMRKRIRDKAAQEGARAVVVTHSNKAGILTLSGSTAEAQIVASVSYVFDAKTKTVTRWEMQWQDQGPSY